MKTVGILALQGCVEPHAAHFRALGAEVRYVRQIQHLEGINGLVLPGGESTTMIRLLKLFGLWQKLPELSRNVPFWGICAGSILMAKSVTNPAQESLGIMDIAVKRNAYGRQLESHQAEVILADGSIESVVFIRAPKFIEWGNDVKVLGKIKDEVSYLSQGRHMVTAFHPELTESHWCHRAFLERF